MGSQAFELCQIDDIPPGTSRGFSVGAPDGTEDIFVVRAPSGLVAYRNSCPHTGGPLDWVADQFLNLEGDLIQCATHDALFRIEDGVCIRGPCSGRALSRVWLEVAGTRLYAVLEPADDKRK